MDKIIASTDSRQGGLTKWLSNGLAVLGWLTVGLATIGFIISWSRDPETLGAGRAAQIGLLSAFAFGAIRLFAKDRLLPHNSRSRFLYRLQGHAVLWTALLLSSTGQDVIGKLVVWYLIVLGILTLANPAISWQQYGADPRRKSGWVVRFLAGLAALLWLLSFFHPLR